MAILLNMRILNMIHKCLLKEKIIIIKPLRQDLDELYLIICMLFINKRTRFFSIFALFYLSDFLFPVMLFL